MCHACGRAASPAAPTAHVLSAAGDQSTGRAGLLKPGHERVCRTRRAGSARLDARCAPGAGSLDVPLRRAEPRSAGYGAQQAFLQIPHSLGSSFCPFERVLRWVPGLGAGHSVAGSSRPRALSGCAPVGRGQPAGPGCPQGPLLVESKEQIQSQQMAGVPAKTQGHSWSCHSVWVEVCSDHPLTRVGAARGACGDTLLPPWAGHVLRLPPTCRALCTGVRLQVAQSHLLWGGRGPKQAPW